VFSQHSQGNDDDPDAIFMGGSTQLGRVLHDSPNTLYLDMSIDLTSDSTWQSPSASAIDESNGMTYWVTTIFESISWKWYLFRVSTEPFQKMGDSFPLSSYIPSLNSPHSGLGAKDDRFLNVFHDHNTSSLYIVTTRSVVRFVGVNCKSSVPVWLWICIITLCKGWDNVLSLLGKVWELRWFL
jgi:hypothetical protein